MILTSRYQVAGEPVILALAVHLDDQGDVVCDTVWVDVGLDAGTYAMLDDSGQHVADLTLPSDLVDLRRGAWATGTTLQTVDPDWLPPGGTDGH